MLSHMQPGPTQVFVDANVLYSRTLRDWFCLFDQESGPDGIMLRWSEDDLTEWMYHQRKRNPSASDAQVGGWRRRLLATCPEAVVIGYEIRPELLTGPDKFDAHVVAAAEKGLVDYLVTSNIRDFDSLQDELEFEIYAPDELLCLISQRRPDAMRAVLQRQLAYWKGKSDPTPLDQALAAAGAPNFAGEVKRQLGQLALTGKY